MTESSGQRPSGEQFGERDARPTRRSSILLGERHTSFFHRCAARGIDLLLGVAIYFLGNALFTPLGALGAALFIAFQDAWGEGQSVGKKIIGLRVIDDTNGENCGVQGSVLRNAPFALGYLFATFSFFWIFLVMVVVPIVILELYLLFTLESGIRLGDVMGNTLVIEDLPIPVTPQL